MKRPYSGESWTRFKELMQNLTKRTSIVETRAKNNEDDIDELQPVVEDLQEFAENNNDMTTGINLLRGTRDFLKTTSYYGAGTSKPVDGFHFGDQFKVTKSNDGFSELSISRSGVGSSIVSTQCSAVPAKTGEEYTISLELLVDDLSEVDGQKRFIVICTTEHNATSNLTANYYTVDDSSLGEPTISGKWCKKVIHYTVPQVNDNTYLVVHLSIAQNGSMHWRKVVLNRGHINNPIWGAAPTDLALEPVNDITTRINLLRGTRDLQTGIAPSGKPNAVYLDGIAYTSSNWEVIKADCPNDFNIIKRTPTGIASHLYFNPVFAAQANNQPLTFSTEVMFLGRPTANLSLLQIAPYTDNDTIGAYKTATIATFGLDYNTLPLNEWIKLVWHVDPISLDESGWLRVALTGNSNDDSIRYYRKPKLEIGTIENTEWTASPFDAARSYDWDNGSPKLLGIIPTSNQILEGADLNDYVISGSYASNGDALIATMKNTPSDFPNGSFRLDVEYMRPFIGQTARVVQTFRAYADGRMWIRRRDTSTWTDWVSVRTSRFLVPIEGGGTGGITTDDARNKLQVPYMDLSKAIKTDNDTIQESRDFASGIHATTDTFIANGLSADHRTGNVFNFVSPAGTIAQLILQRTGNNYVGYRAVESGASGDKMMPPFKQLAFTDSSPYVSGQYVGENLASKFQVEIGSNHIANWLASRASQGNFEGINIGDYVNIACSGTTRRYVIADIDPFYNCGNSGQRMTHHIVMVPATLWKLSSSLDGSYYNSASPGTIRWTTGSNNNGTSTETSPYMASNLHKWESEVAIKQFPKEWQDVMINRIDMVEVRYSTSSTLTDANGTKWVSLGKLWSPSIVDIYGNNAYASTNTTYGLSQQFAIFSKLSNATKYTSNNNAWTRTIAGSSSTNILGFDNTGIPYSYSPTTSLYPFPCFLIG